MDSSQHLQLHTGFRGIRVLDKLLIPTQWEVDIEMYPNPDCMDMDANAALAKIHYLFDYILDGAIIYGTNNRWVAKATRLAHNPIVMLPFIPVDLHIALVLQAKMNALSGEAIEFGFINLRSDTSAGVAVTFMGSPDDHLPGMNDWIGERSHFDMPWWHRDDGSTFDVIPAANDDLSTIPEFAFSLDFINESISGSKPKAKVIRPKFKPKVI